MRYRLGLDVGTNSLGWAVLQLDDLDRKPVSILDSGVRIFQDGRQVKSKSTLKAVRSLARSSRRRLDRYKQRRKYLLSELIRHSLFPSDPTQQRVLQDIDPLKLRAEALDQQIELYEIGRALFHLNQRRGFKSNRKDAESRSGVVRDSIEQMVSSLNESGSRTMGEFLWNRRERGLETRVRRKGSKASDLYQFYPSRELLEDEFSTIWDEQSYYYPQHLTEELKQHFYEIIYFQRPLKPQPKGLCGYLKEESRCYRALPSFQKYRILQEVNNLEWTTTRGTLRLIEVPQARDLVLELLLKPTTKSGTVVFSKIALIVKELGLADGNFRFNLQSDRRKHLDGDLTTAVMQLDCMVGDAWHKWPLEQKDYLVSTLLDPELDDAQVLSRLIDNFELSSEKANQVLAASIPDGTSNLSLEAAKMLSEVMEGQYCIQPDAVEVVARRVEGFANPYQYTSESNLHVELPYYGEFVRGHIIPGQGTEKDHQSRIGMVSNPTVHIALNQIRLVVNELIKRFGHPTSIAVELGRDLPAGEMQKKRYEREQKQNQERNDRLREKLRELNRSMSHDNLVRLKLWEELGENPTDRRCIFSGKMIGITDLFNGNCEIEHLLPFSESLDDSLSNKTVCFRQANRDKGNKIPFEAFGKSPEGYYWPEIFERVQSLSVHKQWRFEEGAMSKWLTDQGDFLARHLNDTRYIGRLTREYLTAICPAPKVDVVTGRLTSLLRHHWGLNSVLNLSEDAKNRDDHRHHAVDAIVVGMTTRSSLQRLHHAARRAEELDLFRVLDTGDEIEPWTGFRDAVEESVGTLIVSHKPTRHRQGKLHNDTAMGIIDGPDNKGKYSLVMRKPADAFKSIKSLSAVKDSRLRSRLTELSENKGIEKAFSELGIKSVRIVESMKAIPIFNNRGEPYKAYKGDSNWAMEIYAMPVDGSNDGRWVEVMVSTFEANQFGQSAANLRKPHPASKLVMRIHRNDCIQIDLNGKHKIFRVQKLSASKISLVQPHEANCDTRDRSSANEFRYLTKSASAIKKLRAVKVDISPTGLVSVRR